MKLFIKNMVCDRCSVIVKQVFEKAGVEPVNVSLGEVELKNELLPKAAAEIKSSLEHYGFEIIDDKKSRLIENIKLAIIEFVRKVEGKEKIKLSAYLSNNLHFEYTYLSTLFSDVEGKTIEQFHILQRIELAKELLVYDELNLNQIADQLGYKNVAHLSGQFKKITGLTPTHFKKMGYLKRKSLDNL